MARLYCGIGEPEQRPVSLGLLPGFKKPAEDLFYVQKVNRRCSFRL